MKGAFIFKHVFTKFFGLTKGRPVSFAYPTWSPKGSRRKGFFSDRGGAAGPVFVSGAAAATSSSLCPLYCSVSREDGRGSPQRIYIFLVARKKL